MIAGLLASILAAPVGEAVAQASANNGSAGGPSADPLRAGKKVLDRHEVGLGNRKITYDRLETPKLKPVPTPTPVLQLVEPVPTAAELEEMRKMAGKRFVGVFLHCTCFNNEFTEVEWREGGVYLAFLTTANFQYLSQLSDFDTGTCQCSFLMGWGESDRAEFEAMNQVFATGRVAGRKPRSWPSSLIQQQKRTGKSAWQVVSTGPVPPEVLKVIEALHTYYDANAAKLAAEFQRREAEQAARERWLKEHPPIPRDTTVEYFPIRSSVPSQSASSGQEGLK
ncbi:MAG: hypothetical protein WCG66_10780 [bacterium]